MAEEQQAAAEFEHGREKIHDAVTHLGRTLLILLLLAFGPAALLLTRRLADDGPRAPGRLRPRVRAGTAERAAPALVPTLLRQGGTVGSLEFTATLFDLIRRGRYTSKPVTTEKKTWGGLKHESVADLELTRGSGDNLTPYEQDVAEVVDSVLADGPERLSKFRDRIVKDRKEQSARFTSFKTDVGKAVSELRWFESSGGKVLGLALGGLDRRWPWCCSGSGSTASTRSPRVGRRRPDRARRLRGHQCGTAAGRAHAGPALAAQAAGRRARGRALGCVPPLPDGLPAPGRGAAGIARALGALPRLRDRVRDRRARAAGRSAAHARGDPPGELDLLDQPRRRPRQRRERARDRRPQLRLRLRADAALERWRWWLLGRRRGRWRWWRGRRLVRPSRT